MNTNTIERVLIGFGAVVLLGFAASYVVAPLKEYNDSLRIAAIVGVALYAVYSFLIQSKDQKEIYSAEKEAEKFESQARKERRRGDELQEANLTLQADLATAKKEVEALNARVSELEAALAEKN
jgi:septal ring factor EnvC (AmiA/AmiB activator)